MSAISITAMDEFDCLVNAEVPLLVQFTATRCKPCAPVKAILQELAEKNHKSFNVAFVDVTETPEIARKYRVHTLPTILLLIRGEKKFRLKGLRTRAEILARLQGELAGLSG